MENFRNFLILQNYSPNTINAYMATIRLFLVRHDPETVTPMAVRDFIYGMAPQSRRRHWSALRTFFRNRPHNPMADIPMPPATIPRIHVPSIVESAAIVESTVDPRNRLILELLYGSGFRIATLLEILISDIDFENRWIILHDKGARQHVKPFNESTLGWLRIYLAQKTSKSDYLFPGLTARSVRRIIANACAKANVKRIGPHSFRHAFAAHIRSAGADIVELKNLLGHRRVETTERYLAITPVTLSESLKKHPRS